MNPGHKLSLFRATRSPYYIYSADYRHTSAGIRCLHYLCHALNELGMEAYLVNAKVVSGYLRTPRLTQEIVSNHYQTGRLPIALYPEVISGSPLATPVTARWLLNRPGHLGGDTTFPKDDLIYYYNIWCLPEGMQGSALNIPSVDTRIFNNLDNPDDGKRHGGCFYAHKYLAFGGKVRPEHASQTSLCQDIPRPPEEIASILRGAEALYCYEPSAIITEALACGCPVLLVATDYWYPKADDPHLAEGGIALAHEPDALIKARSSLGDAVARIDQQQQYSWQHIEALIDHTQARCREVWARGDQHGFDFVKGFLEVTAARLPSHVREVMASKLKSTQSVTSPADVRYQLWKSSRASERDASAPLDENPEWRQPHPKFHLVISLPDDQVDTLARTLESIAGQTYSRWTVSILSRTPAPPGFIDTEELRWLTLTSKGFCDSLNRVIRDGNFDWFAIMAAGDCLAPHALRTLAESIGRHPEWEVVYPDEDNLSGTGETEHPYFKLDFSIEMLRSAPYALGAGLLFRRDLLERLAGMNQAFEGIELYDLTLRAFEAVGARGFGHIADVLYHRTADSGQNQLSDEEIIDLRKTALAAHCDRLKLAVDIEANDFPVGTFHVRYRVSGEETVSIIIPTLNGGSYLQRCVGAIVENTDHKKWQIIVVDQDSDDADTRSFLGSLRGMNNDAIQVITQPRGANLPALINAGARAARGQYLLFLSDAIAPFRRDWLDEMLGYVVQADVGVVGAKTVGLDGKISFAGYILGLGGSPAGLHDLHAPHDALGYFGQLQAPNNPSAVSATCMLTEKELFDELGGFDETDLAGGYSDVDYCLKAWRAERRVVWTPYAVLLQEHMTPPPAEPDDQGKALAVNSNALHKSTPAERVMFSRWGRRIAFDPAYNRNLTLSGDPFDIEIAPWLLQDPEVRPLPRVLAHPGDRNGCGEYRIIAPLRALTSAGLVQGWDTLVHLSIPELERLSPDTLIMQRQISWSQIEVMEEYSRHTQALRVYELDDLITNVQLNNQLRKNVDVKGLNKRLRKALGLCDRFVVATDYLAEQYRGFNPDIRVVPNYLERAVWGDITSKRGQGRKPRVGWAGSVSHDGDLALIRDVVLATRDEIEWVFMGLCPQGVRQHVEFMASVTVEAYPARLASLNLDLALAPLEDVPFNHAKSHLRLLEYGILGWPVICSDITPYRGDFPVTRVKNRYKDWIDAVRSHVADLDALAKQGDALRDHVERNWMLEDHLDVWARAWLP